MFMNSYRSARRALALLALAAAAALPGCSGDTSPANTDGTGAGVDQTTAQQASTTALEMVNQVVGESGNWAQGTFSTPAMRLPLGKQAPAQTQSEAVWDPQQNAWLWQAQVSYTDATDSVNVAASYWVQFRDGTTPQQYPDPNTAFMETHVRWDWNGHLERDGGAADLTYVYTTAMVVSGLHTPTRHFAGTGNLDGRAAGHDGVGTTYEVNVGAAWSVDLGVPAGGGCPTGTVSVSSGAWTLAATYDGSSTASWTLRLGHLVRATGTQPLGCSALNSTTAQEEALTALDAVNQVLTSIPSWAQSAPAVAAKRSAAGDAWLRLRPAAECTPGTPQQSPPAFNSGQSAWNWSWTRSCANANSSFNLGYQVWLQYRDADGIARRTPQGADTLEVHESVELSAHHEQEGQIDQADFTAEMALQVGGLSGDSYAVDGSGVLQGRASSSGGEVVFDAGYAMTWTINVAVSQNAPCPQGNVVINVDDYRLEAVYDGAGHMDWALTRGDSVVASANGVTLACGL